MKKIYAYGLIAGLAIALIGVIALFVWSGYLAGQDDNNPSNTAASTATDNKKETEKLSIAETFEPTGLYQEITDWDNDGIPEKVVYKNRDYDRIGKTHDQKILIKKEEFKKLVDGLVKEAFAKKMDITDYVQSGVNQVLSSQNILYFEDEDGNKLIPTVDENKDREVYAFDADDDSVSEDGKKWKDVFTTTSDAETTTTTSGQTTTTEEPVTAGKF